MKKLLLLALVITVAFAVPAFAEVQNLKVGGDIDIHFVKTSNLDLDDDQSDDQSSDHHFMTTTRLYFSADLTDNVQAYVRIINERDWDSDTNIADVSAPSNSGSSYNATYYDESDVELDLAYIKLSEFLYSPLTLIIGRQEIEWGSGLVVGQSIHTNGNMVKQGLKPSPNIALRAPFLGKRKAFDAARAILDYDPWTIDMFAAKIDEDETSTWTTPDSDDEDENLYGVNVSYVWESEWLTEGYYVYSGDQSTSANLERDTVHTLGIRAEGVCTPIDEKLYLEAEVAHQCGVFDADSDVDSWAYILGASYEFDNQYKPIVGLKYDYRSGQDLNTESSNDHDGWHAEFNNYTIGNLIDKLWTNAWKTTNSNADVRGDGGNIHAITASGSFIPMDDIEVALDWIWAKADEQVFSTSGDDIGNELIGTVTYDYTEDVTFSFMGSFFDPDDAFRQDSYDENDSAYELVGSVIVEF